MSSKSPSNNIVGIDEDLPVTHRHDIYPAIDPEPLYAARSYGGKVVLVTGASRGVGRETALQYARAGALVAILARSGDALEETRDLIVADVPGADVLVLAADVCDVEAVRGAVQSVLRRFGKLDILIANAGAVTAFTPMLNKEDPNAWWNTFEVNIRGSFNFISAAVPALEKTQGYIVVISSSGAQLRFPGASDACISKLAVNRLVEFIVLEHLSVRAFALAPGLLPTRIAAEAIPVYADGGGAPDAVALPAATMLYLTSGRADWLSGRYCSANWDMAEVERDWKDLIVQQGGLLNKLYIPRSRE
ncbi:NAD-P-binding protein [Russula ochroleuca]|uniref:NAD-P-binding protein n=1 Tax=Russula ochroleuca TaxID=152965 RepID=A0A9P5JY56_9AGAM|nr:NAD-P-binding protein [Russula ochroleuca]